MKILIIGGGIGGLATAAFLEQKGIVPTLIEQAPEFHHIGFGMTILPNGRALLRELGIDEIVAKNAYQVPWIELADTTGHVLGEKLELKEFYDYGAPTLIIERATLHDALIKKLEKTEVRMGTTVTKLKNRVQGATVTLNDGTHQTFDLVIAADGIHSRTRAAIFGEKQNKFCNWSIRFFWVPKDIPAPKGVVCLTKERITLALYPLRERTFAGIYEYNPRRIDHPPFHIDEFFPYLLRHGWTKKDAAALIKESHTGHQYYDHLQAVPLKQWYKKRVVLIGDARHGMSPLTGMGASMAMEDGFVLADELAKVSPEDIGRALKQYAHRRTQRMKKVIALNSFVERLYFVTSSWGNTIRRWLGIFLTKESVGKQFKHILTDSI